MGKVMGDEKAELSLLRKAGAGRPAEVSAGML